jgi:hypothetical protein
MPINQKLIALQDDKSILVVFSESNISYSEYVETLSTTLYSLDKQGEFKGKQVTVLVDDLSHVWLASPKSIANRTIKPITKNRICLEQCSRRHLKRLRDLSKKHTIQYVAMDICKYI